jgi:hypothetical protein
MLRYILIVIICSSPFVLKAQEQQKVYYNQIKVSPLRIVDFFNPGIEVNYERLHKRNFSTQLSVTYPTTIFGKNIENFRGYRVAIEEKYFRQKNHPAGAYLSAEIHHSNIRFNKINELYDSAVTIIDTFTVHRQTTALNFKLGRQFYHKQFVLDLSMGVGLKYRDVKHSNRSSEFIEAREPFDFHITSIREVRHFTINIPIAFRLGYRF